MCILSGCDYLSNLPGVGLKKAYILIKQHRSVTKVLRALRLEGNIRIPLTYAADFERALLTFRHQRVYDPVSEVRSKRRAEHEHDLVIRMHVENCSPNTHT